MTGGRLSLPRDWLTEPIVIETYAGQSAYGDQYADPITVLGHITGGLQVNHSGTVDEVVPQQAVILPNPTRLADGSGTVNPSLTLTPESRVTSGAISSTVTRVVEHRQPGMGAAIIYVSGTLS